MNWYYSVQGTQQGPASDAQLVALANEGTVTASTLVWKEGMPEWQPLAAIRPDLVRAAFSSPQVGGMQVLPGQKDLMVQQMREGVLNVGLNYAGFWLRVGAKILDGFIIMAMILAILGLVAGVLYATGLFTPPADPDQPPPAMIVLIVFYYLLVLVLPVVYPAILVARHGATWGKMALGLKVVDAEGNPISKGKSWGRAFADMINQFTCLIGYIIAGFDEQKRALHDHICNTRVTKTR